MIELSILDLLYLSLTFFVIVLGTLGTLVLIRVLKILSVGVEISNYYWQIKKVYGYYSQIPFLIKDKIFHYISERISSEKTEEKNTSI